MVNSQRKKLAYTLEKFYQNPVALVSFELLLSIGAIIFFALFAIKPTLMTMSDLLKEIEDKKALEQKMIQKIASLSSAQTQFISYESRLQVLDEAIPSHPDLIRALKIIEKIAGEKELAIDRLTLSEFPKDNPSSVVSKQITRNDLKVSVGVKGDYQTIRSFVEELMNSRRVFIVETINFKTSESRGSRSLEANISLTIPYFGQ